MFEATFLVPVRNRNKHAKIVIHRLANDTMIYNKRIQVIVIDGNITKTHHKETEQYGFTYIHSPCEGIFHKTKLLNIGLSYATGLKVVPYDIDLLPWGSTITKHSALSMMCTEMLVAGYRLMTKDNFNPEHVELTRNFIEIAPENRESALFKYLSQKERFAVCPYYDRETICSIGGWDEKFKGWGAEDQDMIKKYLSKSKAILVQSYDLLYIHLWHSVDNNWGEQEHINRNRSLFYETK